MEIKYPVKYGVIPVKKLLNYNNEMKNTIVCYIISKCYVVNEIKRYHKDGSSTMKYEVVCPYMYDDYYDQYINEIPHFNLDVCTNSVEIGAIFDTYEEALEAKRIENEELLERQYAFMSLYMPQDILLEAKEKVKTEFNYWLEKYNNVEEVIISATDSLQVTGEPKVFKLNRKVIK